LTATIVTPVSGTWDVRLNWSDNSTNEKGFIVQRSTNGTTFTQITATSSNQPSVFDSSAAPATHYWYRVAAINDAGLSPYSNVAEVTTPTNSGGGGTNSVPAAPSGLTATPLSSGQIQLSWIDNSTNESYFRIERSTNGVSFQPLSLHPPSGYTNAYDAGLNPGTHYWYRIFAVNAAGDSPPSNVADATTPKSGSALPPPWQEQDIGTSGGSATYSNGVFSVIASGADIYGTSDGLHFVFQPGSGDVTIIASLDKLAASSGSVDPWARIGLMIRESVDANSKNAMVFLSSQHGTGFTWRDATGGSTQYIPGNSSDRFVKLARTGNTFSAYSSPDGNSWQLIGSATIDLSNVLIGLAATSHSTSGKIVGQFSQVAVTSGGGGGGGGGSGGSVPAPWQQQDVGPVTLAGSASFSQGTFTIKGDGADIWGSTDAFHYVYLTISGNAELVARVTAIQNTEPWAKAGLMVRSATLDDSPNVFAMETADHGTGFQWRSTHSGGSSYVPGPFWTAPVWLRLQRQGNVVTGSTSLDGANWTTLGTQTISMLDPILIGMAVTSHNTAALNSSMFDNVTFTPLP